MNHEQAMRRALEDELPALPKVRGAKLLDGWTDGEMEAYAREAIAAALVKYTQGQEAVKPVTNSDCRRHLQKAGKPYPRTCSACGLWGPCRYEMPIAHSAFPGPAPAAPDAVKPDQPQAYTEETSRALWLDVGMPEQPQGSGERAELSGCTCRWDKDDNRVQTCERHQGWLDVVHEWAERAHGIGKDKES